MRYDRERDERRGAVDVGAALQAMDLANQALELAGLAAQAAAYAVGSKATATRRAYTSDWQHFVAWCDQAGQTALPAGPATVCLYLTACAQDLKVSTMARRLASINQAHRAAGHPAPGSTPAVRAVWQGISRARGEPPRRKTPLVVDAMRQALDTLPHDPRGVRDRALLLIAWGGALRRSEVCALRGGDVVQEERGLVVTIRRSKTDQTGVGRQIGIPYGRRVEYCPVRAYRAWSAWRPDARDPLFVRISDNGLVGERALNDRHVANLVKRIALDAGLQGDYSGHSLRAGFATAAAAAGASERAIMNQTGHRSLLIARSYIRPAELFSDNAAAVAAL